MKISEIWDSYHREKSVSFIDPNRHVIAREHLSGLDNRQVESLTPAHILVATNQLQALGYKNGTIRRDLQSLKAAINWARENGRINVSPRIPMPSADEPRQVYIGWDDMMHVVKISEQFPQWMQSMVRLMAYTGQRIGAVLSLRWSDVNFAANRINFKATATERSKGRAVVPMHGDLREYLISIKPALLNGLVVDGKTAAGCKPKIAYYWGKLMKASGLSGNVTPHAIRHSVATHLISKEGVSMLEVSQLLGHSSIGITQAVYTHLEPDYLQDAIGAMG